MMTYDPTNIFSKIIKREIPAEILYESDDVLAFMDIMPQAEGHCLVIPKQGSSNLLDADPSVFAPLFTAVQKIAQAAKAALHADGVTIMQFNGAAAGQTVFHLHIHIVPRKDGVPMKPHSGQMEKPEILKAHADKIRAALAEI
jgi:histidine triad (HIT) family protein